MVPQEDLSVPPMESQVELHGLRHVGHLGTGAFAIVYACTAPLKQPGVPARQHVQGDIAVKVLHRTHNSTTHKERDVTARKCFMREALLQMRLQHRNIIKCHGMVKLTEHEHPWAFPLTTRQPQSSASSAAPENWGMILDYAKAGSMAKLLVKQMKSTKRLYSDADMLCWLLDIGSALEYIHAQAPRVVHRDLKTENILMDDNAAAGRKVAMLTDFGLHVRLEGRKRMLRRRSISLHGRTLAMNSHQDSAMFLTVNEARAALAAMQEDSAHQGSSHEQQVQQGMEGSKSKATSSLPGLDTATIDEVGVWLGDTHSGPQPLWKQQAGSSQFTDVRSSPAQAVASATGGGAASIYSSPAATPLVIMRVSKNELRDEGGRPESEQLTFCNSQTPSLMAASSCFSDPPSATQCVVPLSVGMALVGCSGGGASAADGRPAVVTTTTAPVVHVAGGGPCSDITASSLGNGAGTVHSGASPRSVLCPSSQLMLPTGGVGGCGVGGGVGGCGGLEKEGPLSGSRVSFERVSLQQPMLGSGHHQALLVPRRPLSHNGKQQVVGVGNVRKHVLQRSHTPPPTLTPHSLPAALAAAATSLSVGDEGDMMSGGFHVGALHNPSTMPMRNAPTGLRSSGQHLAVAPNCHTCQTSGGMAGDGYTHSHPSFRSSDGESAHTTGIHAAVADAQELAQLLPPLGGNASSHMRGMVRQAMAPLTGRDLAWVYSLTGQTGSTMYMAPEVYLNQPYNEKADVFSFGIITYELASRGMLVFQLGTGGLGTAFSKAQTPDHFAALVAKGKRPPRPASITSDALWSLIERCWHADPNERPDMWEVVRELQKMQQERMRQGAEVQVPPATGCTGCTIC